MRIIRPITLKDAEAYQDLAFQTSAGIFNLPKNRSLLQKKIEESLEAFASNISEPKNELYVFVLEDLETGKIGGTCAIISKVGVRDPIHFYRIETLKQHSDHFSLVPEIEILHPVSYSQGPSEICSLYLKPDFRKEGLGKLLSFSRFLFIAFQPHRFDETIIALMRGYIINEESPFWDAVGHQFVNMSFHELLALEERGGQYLSEIIPKHPIYVSLLPSEAQEVIGTVHPNTKPALKMLLDEGFEYLKEIDPFDGGPKIEAKCSEIKSIKTQKVATVEGVGINPTYSEKMIISNNKLEFRACYGSILEEKNGNVSLPKQVADALQVKPGDQVRFIKNRTEKNK